MARFTLRPLFRRGHSSKRSTTSETRTSSTTASTAALHGRADPSADSPSLPPASPRIRQSTSLAKLRDKFAAQGAEIPEAVQEQRESELLPPPLLTPEASQAAEGGVELETPAPPTPRRSGSITLAGERGGSTFRLSKSDLEGSREPSPGVEEVRLEELAKSPTIQVQEPTPTGILDQPPTQQLQRRAAKEAAANPSRVGEQEKKTPDSGPPSTQPSASSASVSLANTVSRPSDSHKRQQSLVDSANARIVRTLVTAHGSNASQSPATLNSAPPTTGGLDYFAPHVQNMASMLLRKIWVRRPGASATLVQVREDDLVDDVRDMILKKYANSLGKAFDAPDMVLRILSRAEHNSPRSERPLGPEEEMCRTIDTYYPGGQTVHEALIIDVPQKRTPRPSPRAYQHVSYHATDEYRPLENGTDYFPPMPAVIPPTVPQTSGSHDSRTSHSHHPSLAGLPEHQRSMSVLNTGQLPLLPSPGGTRRHREHRPKYQRQHTSSPTIVQHPPANVAALPVNPVQGFPSGAQVTVQPHIAHRGSIRPRLDSGASDSQALHPNNGPNGVPNPPPLPTPPAPEAAPTNKSGSQPPTPSGINPSPHPIGGHNRPSRPKRPRKPDAAAASLRTRRQANNNSPGLLNGGANTPSTFTSSMLDASVPPINVLIVEDNIINLRILEGLMKRLKVRWKTAMNGQIAVDEWRKGGFHLVLMDIQMPVMNGLQATKEIRRLERWNGVGVFSSTGSEDASPVEEKNSKGKERAVNGDVNGKGDTATPKRDDKLPINGSLFKSPVIIVALTASSLQSDRHEALAAGCNDFLTKPVNFVWLERKVKEWGCMQALIDFDGWRRWKDYAAKEEAGKSSEQLQEERGKEERQKTKMDKFAAFQEKQRVKRLEQEAESRSKAGGGEEEVDGEAPESGEGR